MKGMIFMCNPSVQALKANFSQVLEERRISQELKNNTPALEAIFDILNGDRALIAAIEQSEHGKPALDANVPEIESYVAAHPTCGIDLTNDTTKQVIGILQKIVLAPFGYTPVKDKRLTNSNHFSTAACYERTEPAKLKIIKIIAPVCASSSIP
ncbi:MAG: hypothetical protein ACTTJE_02435 [Schwartzia sp. (in: firmicutes)]